MKLDQFAEYLKGMSPQKPTIFIVEDNELYAKSLQAFIHEKFPQKIKISIFRIGEMCLMEMNRNPCIVIMDYYLNSRYEEANNGIEIIKRIKMLRPMTNIVVLSIREKFELVSETIKKHGCLYVQKNEDAFEKVEQFISDILAKETTRSFEALN